MIILFLSYQKQHDSMCTGQFNLKIVTLYQLELKTKNCKVKELIFNINFLQNLWKMAGFTEYLNQMVEYLIYVNVLIIPKEDSNQINLDEIILFFQNWRRTRKNWKDSKMMKIPITNLYKRQNAYVKIITKCNFEWKWIENFQK